MSNNLLDTYRRILRAAWDGRGVRLNADEVRELLADRPAIREAVFEGEEYADG